MGVDLNCVTFIGRLCTPEEVKRCLEAMSDMNQDIEHEVLFSITEASDNNLVKSDDGLPIVAHVYCYCCESVQDLLEYSKDEFIFFVVQHVILDTSNRWSKTDLIPVPLGSLPTAKDERYGLLHAHYAS
jgi:hypothetical protein